MGGPLLVGSVSGIVTGIEHAKVAQARASAHELASRMQGMNNHYAGAYRQHSRAVAVNPLNPEPERSPWEDLEDAKDAEINAWLKGLGLENVAPL